MLLERVRSFQNDRPNQTNTLDRKWRDTVWRLTTLSRPEFEAIYEPLFDAVTPLLDPLQTQQTQQMCVRALKVRQAHIIPKNSAPEDAARMSEAMSFALASCILIDAAVPALKNKVLTASCQEFVSPNASDWDRSAGAWFAQSMLPAAANQWLTSEPAVLNEVLRFFCDPEQSQFTPIIRLAKKKLQGIVSANVQADAVNTSSATTQTTALKDSTLAPSRATKVAKPSPQIATTPRKKTGKTNQSEQGTQGGAGMRFIRWLRTEVTEQRLIPNEADSPIHLLSDGTVFLLSPQIFRAYAAKQGIEPKRVENQFCRAGKHRMRSDGTSRFSASVADGRIVTGYVLKDGGLVFAKAKSKTSPLIAQVN